MLSAISSEPVSGTFLALLDADQRRAIEELAVPRTFSRGSVMMLERERDDRIMLLIDGRVKVTHASREGNETLLSIRDPGDVLGELAFIDHRPRVATVAALESVTAGVMPAQAFRSYLAGTPEVAVVLLEIVARRLREATDKRLQFAALDTMGRVAARIVELADRYGEDSGAGITVLSPISQEELASWTSASGAGVASALQSFRKLGWIETGRQAITVKDPAALRARAT